MGSPQLRMLLRAMHYQSMGKLSDKLLEELAMEELIGGLEGLIHGVKEKDLAKRMRVRSTPIIPQVSLEETLFRYNKYALDGQRRSLSFQAPLQA